MPGDNSGIGLTNGGTFINSGVVSSAKSTGIFFVQKGYVENTGTIYGGFSGIDMVNGGKVVNAGTIGFNPEYGGFSALNNFSGVLDLTALPGAVFQGGVTADENRTSMSHLTLAGATPGSLDLGASFTGFVSIDFAPGSTWTLEGTSIALTAGQTIAGFAGGDTLVLDGFSTTTYSLVPNTGLVLSNATASETLALTGPLNPANYTVTENAAGDTVITDVACFCAGTRIATARGQVAVEHLRIGDLVKTTRGLAPIRWIGTRGYAGRFIAGNRNALPIRIRRHAIAFNVPSRDLYVSPDHAIAEAGVLIHAHLLVNGVSITQLEHVECVEYFHIELEDHAILFAENLATESFLDEGARHRFANAHTAPAARPQNPCLPRVHEGFHLHNIKSRIARRAGIPEPATLGTLRGCIDESTPSLVRGWAQDISNPESPVLLEIFSGGLGSRQTPEIFSTLVLANAFRPDLRAAGLGSGCHGFAVTLPNVISIRRAQDGAQLPRPANKRTA